MSANEGKIRVMIADDHLVVRMGLSAIISIEHDMEVVAEASDGVEAVKLSERHKPDVIIMDIMMPKLDGVNASAEILKRNPDAKILILTTFGTSDALRQAFAVGVTGALVKDSAQTELVDAIRSSAAGKKVVSLAVEHQLQCEIPKATLSPRQREVLNYVAKGFKNSEIASIVGIGRDCVKAHLSTAFTRLGAASRSEAVAIAIRLGLLDA